MTDTTLNVEDADILTTKGIESSVIFGNEVAGHILLLDYDHGYDPEKVFDLIEDLPGITLVFRSSPNSFHVWNLTVRDKKDTACKALEMRSDPNHTQIGYNYGRWTLRVTPKKENNGDAEKDAPELLKVAYNETEKAQSQGHWRFARAMFGSGDEPLPTIPRKVNWFGDSYSIAKYMTVKQELKERYWEDGDG